MYCGDNKTALDSQRMIADAMLSLLKERAFTELSVSDLCKCARVSRQTFYSLFGTKEKVLIYALHSDCGYEPDREQEGSCRMRFKDFCRSYSRYIVCNRAVLKMLVRNDLMHCLYDIQYESLLSCESFMADRDMEERQYLVDFIACGMNSIARTYVLTGCRADETELERLMYRLFSGEYIRG